MYLYALRIYINTINNSEIIGIRSVFPSTSEDLGARNDLKKTKHGDHFEISFASEATKRTSTVENHVSWSIKRQGFTY